MGRKGAFYTLEAAIAVVIIVTTLAYTMRTQATLELSKANLKQKVFDSLKILDDVGDLRKDVLQNNATAIKVDLSDYITESFDVALFNKTSNLTATPVISEQTVVTVSYFIAGNIGNYTPREIRVYVWGIE